MLLARAPVAGSILLVAALTALTGTTGGSHSVANAVARKPLPRSLVALVNASAPPDDLFSVQFCGGVLIGPTTVATVAHCMRDRTPQSVDVVVGADNLCQGNSVPGERLHVKAMAVAPPGHDSDIVVLHLGAPSTTTPALVAGSAGRTEPGGTAVGWGRSELRGAYPCRGRTVPLQAGDPAVCLRGLTAARPPQPTVDVWCGTSEGEQNTCVGDSGGPVYVRGEGRETVFALISWGASDCGPDAPGFYSVLAGDAVAPWGTAPLEGARSNLILRGSAGRPRLPEVCSGP